jgi:tyrosine-protein phosphatase SIW14
VTARLQCALLFIPLLAHPQTPQPPTPGLRNFHQVNEHIYRGAQPAVWGYKTLSDMGVKTVIDLRGDGISEALERRLVAKNKMNFVGIPFDGHKAPTDDQIARVISLLNDPAQWPIYVHCRRGADRTGTVIACYRIAHDQWDNNKALDEAKSFDMDPAQKLMQKFILAFHVSEPTLTPQDAAESPLRAPRSGTPPPPKNPSSPD